MTDSDSTARHRHEAHEGASRFRKAPAWQKKDDAVHELRAGRTPVAEIARSAGVSRQTLHDWAEQHDAALELVWGRSGGPARLRQLGALESALESTRSHEESVRQTLAAERRAALVLEIANEFLRSTSDPAGPDHVIRAALVAAVERARAASIPLRELAPALGMSIATLRRKLAPPSSDPPPDRPPHPRPNKVHDPVIREAVREVREEFGWGPLKIAQHLGSRAENKILVCKNVVARILKELGLSRPYEPEERSDRRMEILCPLPVTGSDIKKVPLTSGATVYLMPLLLLQLRVVLGFAIFRHAPTSADVRDAFTAILDGSLGASVFAHRTDNGPETKGFFRSFLKELKIWRWTGPPHWPRSNGLLERLIQAFDDEVLVGKTYATVEELAAAAVAWLDRYNLSRPHEALGGIAPLWNALGWLADPLERLRHLEVLRDGMVHRPVGRDGRVEWNGEQVYVGRCFRRKTIGLFEHEGWISVWLDGIPLFRITAKPEKPAEAAAA